jgi:3-dehydroquinate dehydratase-1
MRAKKISQSSTPIGQVPASMDPSTRLSANRRGDSYRDAKPFHTWGYPPLVVGTIHSPGSLQCALQMSEGAVDFLELRVDHFADQPEVLLRAVARLRTPMIVTVRHPNEGGARPLSWQQRKDLFARFLPVAAFIDVELRSTEKLTETIGTARATNIRIIVSDHHFRVTPSRARLAQIVRRAQSAGADVVKVAGCVERVSDLGRLVALFSRRSPTPLSVMGMGRFGKVSRLLFACAGSVLNYGYLDRRQVAGQWEATLLKKRIAELFAE